MLLRTPLQTFFNLPFYDSPNTCLVLERDDARLEHAEAGLHGEDDEAGRQDPGGVVPVPHRPRDHLVKM